MDLLSIVVLLIVVGILLWGVNQLGMIDSKIKQIINILVIVVVALWLLSLMFPGLTGIRVGRY